MELREIVSCDTDNGDNDVSFTSTFSVGDIFMMFEYVPYDLSGILKSDRIVSVSSINLGEMDRFNNIICATDIESFADQVIYEAVIEWRASFAYS